MLDWLINVDIYQFFVQCLLFFSELMGGTLLFAFIFPHRRKLLLRLSGFVVGSILVTALVLWGAFFIYKSFDLYDLRLQIVGAVIAVLYLFFILCLCITMVRVCFVTDIWGAMLCGVCGYSVQHIIYRIDMLAQYYFFYGKDSPWHIPFVIFSIISVYAVNYFIFVRKFRAKGKVRVENRRLILLTGLVLQIMMIFGVCGLFYLGSKELRSTAMVLVECGMAVTICYFVLFFVLDSVRNINLEEENRIIRMMWQADRKQYEISKRNIDQLNIKYHDLKYILRSIKTDGNADNEINRCLRLYEALYNTGCEPLDVVLTEKNMLAMRYGITLSCMADGSLLAGMEPLHVYSLFGNALDNAVECLKDVEDPEKKLINFSLSGGKGRMITVRIENFTPVVPEFKDGLPVTSKQDGENHGFGTRSIRNIVQSYGGFMDMSVKDEIFVLTVIFPRELKYKNNI